MEAFEGEAFKIKILKIFMNTTKQGSFVVIFVEGGDLKMNGEML